MTQTLLICKSTVIHIIRVLWNDIGGYNFHCSKTYLGLGSPSASQYKLKGASSWPRSKLCGASGFRIFGGLSGTTMFTVWFAVKAVLSAIAVQTSLTYHITIYNDIYSGVTGDMCHTLYTFRVLKLHVLNDCCLQIKLTFMYFSIHKFLSRNKYDNNSLINNIILYCSRELTNHPIPS